MEKILVQTVKSPVQLKTQKTRQPRKKSPVDGSTRQLRKNRREIVTKLKTLWEILTCTNLRRNTHPGIVKLGHKVRKWSKKVGKNPRTDSKISSLIEDAKNKAAKKNRHENVAELKMLWEILTCTNLRRNTHPEIVKLGHKVRKWSKKVEKNPRTASKSPV